MTLMHKGLPLLPNRLNLSLLPKAETCLQSQESPYELKQRGDFLNLWVQNWKGKRKVYKEDQADPRCRLLVQALL